MTPFFQCKEEKECVAWCKLRISTLYCPIMVHHNYVALSLLIGNPFRIYKLQFRNLEKISSTKANIEYFYALYYTTDALGH